MALIIGAGLIRNETTWTEIKALVDGCEHAEGKAIDLEYAERVDIVLVPLNKGAVGHGPVADKQFVGGYGRFAIERGEKVLTGGNTDFEVLPVPGAELRRVRHAGGKFHHVHGNDCL